MTAISLIALGFSVAALALSFLGRRTIDNKLRVTDRKLAELNKRADEAANILEGETNKKLDKLATEVRGRTFAILGYVIGELSVDEEFEEPTDAERLREAIYYCQKAYTFLKDSGIPTEFMALNNMLYYYCILGMPAELTDARNSILKEARRLRVAAEQHDSPNLLLTYARTILNFGVVPEELDEACSIVAEVSSPPHRLNEKQRREVELLARLCQQRTTTPPR